MMLTEIGQLIPGRFFLYEQALCMKLDDCSIQNIDPDLVVFDTSFAYVFSGGLGFLPKNTEVSLSDVQPNFGDFINNQET